MSLFVRAACAPPLTARGLFARLGRASAAFSGASRLRVGWGEAAVVASTGKGRLSEAARGVASLAAGAEGDASEVELLGGFSFEPELAGRPRSLRFLLPALSYVRDARGPRVVAVAADRVSAELAVASALCALSAAAPAEEGEGAAGVDVPDRGASEFERRVALTLQEIERGRVQKVVLLRRERVHRATPFDPEATFARLVEAHPSARAFLFRWPDEGAFLGASPELLVSVSGLLAESEALAGTRESGSLDGWTQKEHREHDAVVFAVERGLAGLGKVAVGTLETRAFGPVLHLRTSIACQLRQPTSILLVAEALHPTPALGGTPREEALRVLREVEGEDRGLYGGAVGALDFQGGGELAVAIRCAALHGVDAVLFGGAGIVRGSIPSAEVAETRAKLGVVAASLVGAQ